MEAQSKISLKESERRWKILLERTRRTRSTTSTATADQHQHPPEETEDPFDCTCLAVPPTFDLVRDVATDFVQQWKDLDERKVVADGVVVNQQLHPPGDIDPPQPVAYGDDNDDDDEDTSSQGPRKKPRVETTTTAASSVLQRPVWYDKHVRLPENFDYASRSSEPPVAHETDDRVISLTDPNQLLSYPTELWDLFRSVPTVAQLEEDAVTTTATEEGGDSCRMQHTQKLQKEIMDTLIVYPRLDGHALSRLRFSDRHDPVPPPATDSMTHVNFTPTIRFECWRRQPRRGTIPEPHRLVLEFAGSQTLLDFHRAIVELAEDVLWSSNLDNTTTDTTAADATATNATATDATATDATAIDTTAADATTNTAATTAAAPQNNAGDASDQSVTNHDSSGFFFLENIFYTTGSVDYTGPVQTWLQSGSRKEQDQRAAHLGLPRVTVTSSPEIPVRSMADTRLEDLSLRLGIRYLYCCHGDVECSILCTDRRMAPTTTNSRAAGKRKSASPTVSYPIVHDIWMPSYLIPECEACRHRVAVIATSTECEETDGHATLCEDCSRQLQLQTVAPDKIQEYSVWRSQADLSAGAASESLF